MKVAYFAESPADQAALLILTEAILDVKTDAVTHQGLRHRGWPAVRTVLPAVLRELHYHTDAEGLVLAVDSNGSPPHLPAHEAPGVLEANCRLCQLRRIAADVFAKVRPRPFAPPLKIAIGLAVPTIEAWLLCGADPHASEAAWINGQKAGRLPYSKSDLKRQLYGTSHPSLATETVAMQAAAMRLASTLDTLDRLFPHGFRALSRTLQDW
jgi:hypothetical protein